MANDSSQLMVEEGSKKTLVVVLGMHRSGTSAITRGLRMLQVEMGESLIPGEEGRNAKGYWEDIEINAFNGRLLARLDTSWYGLRHLDKDLFSEAGLDDLRDEAKALLEQKTQNILVFGFKDPRTCILLPFWQPIFSELGLDDRYLITLRNPLDVANSLAKRDAFPQQHSFLMWAKHIIGALEFSRGKMRVLVSYDAFLESTKAELKRIAAVLDLKLIPGESDALREYSETFLTRDLCHSKSSQRAVESCQKAPPFIGLANQLLQRVADGTIDLDTESFRQAWAGIEQIYEQLIPVNAYIDQLHADAANYHEQVTVFADKQKSLLSQLDKMHLTVADSDKHHEQIVELANGQKSLLSQLEKMHLAVFHQDGQFKELNPEISGREGQVATLSQAIAGRDGQIAALNQEIAGRDGQNSGLNETVAQLHQRLGGQERLLQERSKELERIYQSNTWRLSRLPRALRRSLLTRPYAGFRRKLSILPRKTWCALNLTAENKRRLKNNIFRILPTFLRNTRAYRAWEVFEGQQQAVSGGIPDAHSVSMSLAEGNAPMPVPLLDARPLDSMPVRLLAFYLPQFHPIAENDEWWGEGFTEWKNVRPAKPQFEGHYQPHIPGELGYYDLRDQSVQQRQIELARLYGVGGFCFYFYWFAGKRLLEQPLLDYLDAPSLDFPFCLCWANENWCRTWDGLDSEILIAQEHSPEDDFAFIEYVARYLKDPRYIRIGDKPLLLVYRPNLLPCPADTVVRWRQWCRENGIGEIYLAYTQSFEAVNPKKYNFDAAIEFPPNNSGPPIITDQVNADPDFSGVVYDWRVFPERSRHYQQPKYTLFRAVNTAWDNSARRKNRGAVFALSSPEGYQEWLFNAVQDTIKRFKEPDERIVFVNAWNEWAEGAHLEPDQRYGYAYLQATRNALAGAVKPAPHRIVLVGHDAHSHGAQTLLLYMARMLVRELGFQVDVVLLGGGSLLSEYRAVADVHLLSGDRDIKAEGKRLAKRLYAEGIRSAIANTTVSGIFAAILKRQGFSVASLIHELPGVIEQYRLQAHVAEIAENIDPVVFAAQHVMDGFQQFSKLSEGQGRIRSQGLYKKNPIHGEEQVKMARHRLRKRFGLPDDALIVLGVGYADHRKGIDLFVETGTRVIREIDTAFFIWLGHFDLSLKPEIDATILRAGLSDRFIFPGLEADTRDYYAGADVYALTSREDPFPSVVMESLDAALPVVAFDGAGGFSELLDRGCGLLVPAFDTAAYARAVVNLLNDADKAAEIGLLGKKIIDADFSFRRYVFDLVSMVDKTFPRVSVVVPNYNYADYLASRINSIAEQDYPVYELIILDDASTDNSLRVMEDVLSSIAVDVRVVVNDVNTGSPFLQWYKGVELARGDLVWIAEADDLAASSFLREVIKPFEDEKVVLSYCQSRQMGGGGEILSPDYLDYVADVSDRKWLNHYTNDGIQEIREALSIKNTIPNASGVVFRRSTIKEVLDEHLDEIEKFSVAGDWVTYIHTLAKGRIAFSPESLNLHRRHESSVTLSAFDISQLEEILSVQKLVRGEYKPDAETVMKASQYSGRLYEQFGLASSEAPTIGMHERLIQYMDK